MRIAAVALLVLLLACCSAQPQAGDKASARPPRAQTDMYCMDDCVGNGGTRDFCRQRCTD